ncbi:MAG: histone deacetylase family protein [Thermoprotei archaeon]|nr:MAG: histone deacetylase family protein [Thermoprotei archaeon]
MRELVTLYSAVFLEHVPPFPHPERPERLKIALSSLKEHGLLGRIVEPVPAEERDLYRVHDPEYVARVRELVEAGAAMLDNDTYISRGTMRAALTAAGASLRAAEAAVEGRAILILPRPPGHHAGRRGRAMGALTQGFCIFNNAALAVARLLELGLRRVAVLDFDSHHGNGTQEIFYSDPRVLHVDLHEDPVTLYPGTGFPTDLGSGEGEGFKVNVVLPPSSGDDAYALALEEVVVPLLESFKPEALVYSAGFDAYAGDGLSHLRAGAHTYSRLGLLAGELGVSRVIAVLEGGYEVGLEKGLPSFVASLISRKPPFNERFTSREPVLRLAREYIDELKALLRRYWSL